MIKKDNVFIFRTYIKGTVMETNIAGKTGQLLVKKIKLDHSNLTIHKNKLKMD